MYLDIYLSTKYKSILWHLTLWGGYWHHQFSRHLNFLVFCGCVFTFLGFLIAFLSSYVTCFYRICNFFQFSKCLLWRLVAGSPPSCFHPSDVSLDLVWSQHPKSTPFIASVVWVTVSWIAGLVLSSLTSLLCLRTSSLNCKKGGLQDQFSECLRVVKLSLTCPHVWWTIRQGQNCEFKYFPLDICRYIRIIVCSIWCWCHPLGFFADHILFLSWSFFVLFVCFKSGCSEISQLWS